MVTGVATMTSWLSASRAVEKGLRKKPSRPKHSKNWRVRADLHFMLIGEHLHVFLYTRYSGLEAGR